MGEEDWRVYNVGALNIDSILSSVEIGREDLFRKFKFDSNQKLILCIFHSVNLEIGKLKEQMHEIVEALKELEVQTIILYPNNDAGSQNIIEEIEKARDLPFVRIFPNLAHREYISLLKYADVLIGNSSSAIIEAPTMRLPAINIGLRNTGREHAENIIFIKANKAKIVEAIEKALHNKDFRKRVELCRNPYGDGRVADKIIKIISEVEINERLLHKKLVY